MDHLLQVRKRVLEDLCTIPAMQAVLAGRPDPRVYARYLINTYHYSRHSAKVMAIGAARCMDDHPELAAYLLHHADEERGHDQWALADLQALNIGSEQVRATAPVPSCEALVGYIHYVAGYANPVGLFGWMYVLEALGEDLGTMAGQALRGAAALAGSVRFVAGHGASDVGHTRELTEQITQYVRSEADRAAVDRVGDVVGVLFVRMFREIAGEAGP